MELVFLRGKSSKIVPFFEPFATYFNFLALFPPRFTNQIAIVAIREVEKRILGIKTKENRYGSS